MKWARRTRIHRWVSERGRRRSHALVDRIDDFVEQQSKVLDVGPGGGWISEELVRRKGVDATLVDVTDFNFTSMPIDIYDGETLPYPDDSFDSVLLIYTLHHCAEPVRVLKEAVRVSRRRLVIIEDTPHSRLSHFSVVLWDILSNIPTLLIPPGMRMPLTFKSRDEWKSLFRTLGLDLTEEQPFKQKSFVHKAVFVVDKVSTGEARRHETQVSG